MKTNMISSNKICDNTSNKISDKTSNKISDKSSNKTSGKNCEKACEKAREKAYEKACEKISKKSFNKTSKKLSNKILKEVKELNDELSTKFKTTGEYLLSLQMPRRERNKKNKQKALSSIRKVFASCSPEVEADKEEFGFNPVGKKEYNFIQDIYGYEDEDEDEDENENEDVDVDEYNLDQDDEYDLDYVNDPDFEI